MIDVRAPRLPHVAGKEMIGSTIGEGSIPFQAALRSEFCALFDFQDRPFLECIRVFFQAFRLPGESQQIDRMYGCGVRVWVCGVWSVGVWVCGCVGCGVWGVGCGVCEWVYVYV